MLVNAGYRDEALVQMAAGEELSPTDVSEAARACGHIADGSAGEAATLADQILRHIDTYLLERELGERYYPLGILCGEGECRAVNPATGSDRYCSTPLPKVREHNTEAALNADGRGFVTSTEFHHPGPRRFIGWRVDTRLFETAPEQFEVGRPSSDFPALVYFPSSEADTSA